MVTCQHRSSSVVSLTYIEETQISTGKASMHKSWERPGTTQKVVVGVGAVGFSASVSFVRGVNTKSTG
jgi:hypothetical protein